MTLESAESQANHLQHRRLDRALQHVNKFWFPINTKLHENIKQGFQDKRYELDIDFLIGELRSDFALFAYTLRRVSEVFSAEKIQIPKDLGPLAILRFAGLERLISILNIDSERISPHNFSQAQDFQISSIQDSLIGASAAEVLAKSATLDQELTFSVSLLRQLGHILIAWNYPTVYRRIHNNLPGDQSFDQEISNALGFSPSTLSLALLQQWGVLSHLEPAFESYNAEDVYIVGESSQATQIQRLCLIGEALARANNPSQYPSATQDWTIAKQEIFHLLGESGLEQIRECARTNFQQYSNSLPDLFHANITLDPERELHKVNESKLYSGNQFIDQLNPAAQEIVQSIYRDLSSGKNIRSLLSTLLQKAVPAAGFSAAVVYTLDPDSMTLTPRARTGTPQINNARPHNYNNASQDEDSIVGAFRCSVPIIEHRSGLGMSFITAAFADTQRVGVLYLELSSQWLMKEDSNALASFKAIRLALIDCLALPRE